MAALKVDAFTIPQAKIDAISTDGTQITTHVVFDPDPPAGWKIIATGPLGSTEVCPKPCPKVIVPPSQ